VYQPFEATSSHCCTNVVSPLCVAIATSAPIKPAATAPIPVIIGNPCVRAADQALLPVEYSLFNTLQNKKETNLGGSNKRYSGIGFLKHTQVKYTKLIKYIGKNKTKITNG
jgi:hypothetical protein